jgi:hypothetical protein
VKQKPKTKIKPNPALGRKAGTPRERMFREAFFPDRQSRKPLLVREKPNRRGVGWGMISLWTALILVIAYTVFFSDFHSIRKIAVSGTKDVSSAAVDSFVHDRLSGRRLHIFPRDNFFSAPIASLEQEMLIEFPKLSRVSITRRFPDGLSVDIAERDRLLLWCSSGPCYLVNDDGTAAEARFADTEKNQSFLTRIVDESARPVGIGEHVIASETVRNILLLEAGLQERSGVGIVPPFFSPSRVSDEIRIRTDEGWELMVSLDVEPEKTIASLRLVLEKEIPQEKRSSLRYIDLRTENRAFFTYKDSAPPQDGATAEQGGAVAASQSATFPDAGTKKSDGKKK